MAEYALRGINHPIGVGGYRLGDVLLGDFAKYLPSPEDLQNRMQEQSRRAGVGSFFLEDGNEVEEVDGAGPLCACARSAFLARLRAVFVNLWLVGSSTVMFRI